jgi:PAS domain S-box-containing protein
MVPNSTQPVLKEKTAVNNNATIQLELELKEVRAEMIAMMQLQEEAREEFLVLNEQLESSQKETENSNEKLQSINNELQMRNEMLTESYDYSAAIIATIHEPMIVLDEKFLIKSANKAFYEKFSTRREETVGLPLFELGNKQWSIPKLKKKLEGVLSKNNDFYGFEVTHTFPGIGEKIMLLNAYRIIQKNHKSQLILLAIEDITERTLYHLKEKELLNTDILLHKADKEELENAVKARTIQIGQKNQELENANWKLAFQNDEKEKRAAELSIANMELAFQNKEKEKRAAELSVANIELAFQNKEKEKRAAELSIANKELAFQNDEKEKRAAELSIANKELAFQNDEKEKRAAELSIANIELAFQNDEKEKRAAELSIANTELAFQNDEKEKRAAELSIANTELAFQNDEKEKRAAELSVANTELAFQNDEKEKRAAELSVANIDLAFQNEENEKRAAELSIANTELAFQNDEKEKRAAELSIANKELAFQNDEKEKRAAELSIANIELAFQNDEKEKRAAELGIANTELAFQNDEKEKRATELSIANTELAFQNDEKEKRATELSIANTELAFQNDEKEKRAAELGIANMELAFQNNEKEKRATELSIANTELAFQNDEKEKRAAELSAANKDLTTFTYVSSHDLQEPLRKIQNFVVCIMKEDEKNLSATGKGYFLRMRETAKRMQSLIEDLLTYSRTKSTEHIFEHTSLDKIMNEVLSDFEDIFQEKKATIEFSALGEADIIPFQFRQLLHNLVTNSLKFSKPGVSPHIIVKSELVSGKNTDHPKLAPEKNYLHITFTDNGIGFDPKYKELIFEVFQRLYSFDQYKGTGIGLAICKRIVENHHGIITATGKTGEGARFNIFIPAE